MGRHLGPIDGGTGGDTRVVADLNADRTVPDLDGDGKDEDVGLQRTSHNDWVALRKDWSRPEKPSADADHQLKARAEPRASNQVRPCRAPSGRTPRLA